MRKLANQGNDISGLKFNNMKVIKMVWNEKYNRHEWLCRCDCGNEKIVAYSKLKSGHTKSCGCLKLKKTIESCTTHDMSKTRFWNIWMGIKGRCTKEYSTSYKRYGALGIKICDRWLDFSNFKEDMHESYLAHVEKHGEKNTTIDRINSKDNYYKENCRWANYEDQNRNKSNNRKFKATSPSGEIFYDTVISRFSKEHNINEEGIRNCLYNRKESIKGWTFERIEDV